MIYEKMNVLSLQKSVEGGWWEWWR